MQHLARLLAVSLLAATSLAQPGGPTQPSDNRFALGTLLQLGLAQEGEAYPPVVTGKRANTRNSPNAEPDDLWHLGSITKSMTSVLAARLVEQDVIAWRTTVGDIFEDAPETYRDVTLVELLAHRSGIPGSGPAAGVMQGMLWRLEGDMRAQRRAATDLILQSMPLERGTHHYSNFGYIVAGAMLEARTDRSWESLMRVHVFEPLGMTSAGFGAPGKPDEQSPSQPYGHTPGRFGVGLVPVRPGDPASDNPAVLGPAGTVHASLEDLRAYANAHLAGATGDESFLTSESWERLHTPLEATKTGDESRYALGVMLREAPWAGDDRVALWHNGSNTMWYAEMWIVLPAEDALGGLFLTCVNAPPQNAQRVFEIERSRAARTFASE